jgi:hypothetical protein
MRDTMITSNGNFLQVLLFFHVIACISWQTRECPHFFAFQGKPLHLPGHKRRIPYYIKRPAKAQLESDGSYNIMVDQIIDGPNLAVFRSV